MPKTGLAFLRATFPLSYRILLLVVNTQDMISLAEGHFPHVVDDCFLLGSEISISGLFSFLEELSVTSLSFYLSWLFIRPPLRFLFPSSPLGLYLLHPTFGHWFGRLLLDPPFWRSQGGAPTPAWVLPAEEMILWFVFELMRSWLKDLRGIHLFLLVDNEFSKLLDGVRSSIFSDCCLWGVLVDLTLK
ncbi:hypothetical protein AMTR_s00245p00014020 [Amborella trichopoda]|uniref:Uncharacterized protein n=1 Tax=Amborella trichopoda TaxID=13333 RepID=W1NSS8_AMBTC|nr:hypothetical protein AMTR_s00245p00014020 [Amborella trichopoda]